AYPSAHIYITISRAGAIRIYVFTNMCILLAATSTTPASNIKRDRYKIAFFNKFYISTGFNDLTCDFMTKNKAGRGCRSTTHHMLVTSANISCYNLQDNAMFTFTANV